MDKLVTTAAERYWNPEAFIRDEWVRARARSLPPGSWVLDAGAGASKYRPLFQHCRYETQDFCAYKGELVKYIEPITYVCDITAIPLPDHSLDAVLCTEVFEHVTDPMAVLAEFSRLLKTGGKLFLTAPLLSRVHMEPYHYYGGFTKYWYQHWLPRNNFVIDGIEPNGGPGRTSVAYLQALNNEWGLAEAKLRGWARTQSKLARLPLSVLANWVLPRTLPRLDSWLGASAICSGYMVAATRSGTPPATSGALPKRADPNT